jgi:hypothetical protein
VLKRRGEAWIVFSATGLTLKNNPTHCGEFPPNPPFLPLAFDCPQIDKLSILEAADRGTNSLIDAKEKVVPPHIELVVEQVAVPGDA